MHQENALRLDQQPVLAGRAEEEDLHQAVLPLLDSEHIQEPLQCSVHHNHIPDVPGHVEAAVHRVLLQGQSWQIHRRGGTPASHHR